MQGGSEAAFALRPHPSINGTQRGGPAGRFVKRSSALLLAKQWDASEVYGGVVSARVHGVETIPHPMLQIKSVEGEDHE